MFSDHSDDYLIRVLRDAESFSNHPNAAIAASWKTFALNVRNELIARGVDLAKK